MSVHILSIEPPCGGPFVKQKGEETRSSSSGWLAIYNASEALKLPFATSPLHHKCKRTNTNTHYTNTNTQIQVQKYQIHICTTLAQVSRPTRLYLYSRPSLVVPFFEELISRTFLDENQFRLVSQDRVRSQNRIGCLVFVSRTVLSCLTHSPLINAECQEDSIVFLLKRPKWISHR